MHPLVMKKKKDAAAAASHEVICPSLEREDKVVEEGEEKKKKKKKKETKMPQQRDASLKVAVAVDKDRNSQNAFRWALDNVVPRGQTFTLLHVNTKRPANEDEAHSTIIKEIFLPLRCLGSLKDVQCNDVILDEAEVAKAIIRFVASNSVEKLVVGASPKGGFVRTFRGGTDLSSAIFKGAPDFCTVYVISRSGKVTMRNAARPPPLSTLPLRAQVQAPTTVRLDLSADSNSNRSGMKTPTEPAYSPWNLPRETESIKSAFTTGGRNPTARSYGAIMLESDISYVSNHRPSVDCGYSPRLSNISDLWEGSLRTPAEDEFSSFPREGTPPQPTDNIEEEIRRLKLELKKTMDMYSTACKEALTAKQKAMELQNWKAEEEKKRLEEARLSEEAALASAEKKSKAFHDMPQTKLGYRKYTIEEIETATENFAQDRKIGEGGYGPVFRCSLDHTPVAIKVLRPDAAQGRSQFQQEVEILCCIRHPNMVILLGACPEYGCLVYEYMANGSLEDRLFRRGNTPPIPWQHRFRIAAEIGTGLLFLHQTKPEPLVHRDLKPANILLDRNYVGKISDVGLARLVPPSVANSVTQYRLTATAGTFCYIDPEYQQTGLLGIKSDIYSFGILLLQIITGTSPMGLTHLMQEAIEKETFVEMLDKSVPDWPIEEALSLAKLALMCAQLRRKDRPDLGTAILPELNRLRELAEENMKQSLFGTGLYASPVHSQISAQVTRSGPAAVHSATESSRSC